jgi:hypothetical protein
MWPAAGQVFTTRTDFFKFEIQVPCMGMLNPQVALGKKLGTLSPEKYYIALTCEDLYQPPIFLI